MPIMIDTHRVDIATAVADLCAELPEQGSTLVWGLQLSVAIGHFFGALVELQLPERELTVDIVRAVWVVREEYVADPPLWRHPLQALYEAVGEVVGERLDRR